eukprot:7932866-Pyramimonas_sp.AAC.1
MAAVAPAAPPSVSAHRPVGRLRKQKRTSFGPEGGRWDGSPSGPVPTPPGSLSDPLQERADR